MGLAALSFVSEFAVFCSALWRDEVNGLNVATQPSLSGVWHSLQFDSAPIAWFLILRAWSALGLASDTGLRLLGFVTTAAIGLALYVNARRNHGCWPIASYAILGANPIFLRYASSIRSYGLAILMIVIAASATAAYLRTGGRRLLLLSSLAVLLMMQATYTGVIFGVCLALALALTERAKGWPLARDLAILIGPGLICMLPYVWVLREAARWSDVLSSPIPIPYGLIAAMESVGAFHPIAVGAWAAFAALATLAVIRRPRDSERSPAGSHFAFWSIFAASGLIGFTIYVYSLRYAIFSWHCLPATAVIALWADSLFASLIRGRSALNYAAIFALAVAYASNAIASASELKSPQTNIDLAASLVARQALPGDLVVFNPWFYEVSFDRYANRSLARVAVPFDRPVDLHRFDWARTFEASPAPLAAVERSMAQTLAGGQSVLLVGDAVLGAGQARASQLAPAPDPAAGWNHVAYENLWTRQISAFLVRHARQCYVAHPVDETPPVPYEDIRVFRFTGWK